MVAKRTATGIEPVLSAVRRCLAARPEIAFAYLFGSLARGDAHGTSDVDVAVYVADEPPTETFGGYRASLLSDLLACVGRNDVDLVLLKNAPVMLQHRVLRDGQLVLCRNEALRVQFADRVLRQYFDTAPLRRLAQEYQLRSIERGTFGRPVAFKRVSR